MTSQTACLDLAEKGLELEAVHAFEHIDTRKLDEPAARAAGFEWLRAWPHLLRHEDGTLAVCLRYGVVVFCGSSTAARRQLLAALEERGNPRRSGEVEYETLRLRAHPDRPSTCSGGELWVDRATFQHLQLSAIVLGRSVLLASYEEMLRDADSLVEPLAQQLASGRGSRQSSRDLLRHIGTALSVRLALFNRAEVTESPDLLWDNPELERSFHHLMADFDIRPRSAAIAQKVDVLSDTAKAALELVRHTQTLRVEWYIVLLIVAEIALALAGV